MGIIYSNNSNIFDKTAYFLIKKMFTSRVRLKEKKQFNNFTVII